jgi:hypothetical protein
VWACDWHRAGVAGATPSRLQEGRDRGGQGEHACDSRAVPIPEQAHRSEHPHPPEDLVNPRGSSLARRAPRMLRRTTTEGIRPAHIPSPRECPEFRAFFVKPRQMPRRGRYSIKRACHADHRCVWWQNIRSNRPEWAWTRSAADSRIGTRGSNLFLSRLTVGTRASGGTGERSVHPEHNSGQSGMRWLQARHGVRIPLPAIMPEHHSCVRAPCEPASHHDRHSGYIERRAISQPSSARVRLGTAHLR